ncbi:MAG: hypothetical protein M3P04_06495 [Actinomycetota bacterium]|nr:hypothetical protein [Actinomycetota bacterium]
MSTVSPRLARWIEQHFQEPGSASAVIVDLSSLEQGERVQAAVALWSYGNYQRFREAIQMARDDWRDALARAGLENDNWPYLLDLNLGRGDD